MLDVSGVEGRQQAAGQVLLLLACWPVGELGDVDSSGEDLGLAGVSGGTVLTHSFPGSGTENP